MKHTLSLCVIAFSFFASTLISTVSSSKIDLDNFILNANSNGMKTIVVDKKGKGNFRTIQEAVDSVPSGNSEWIKIRIKNGIYNEKVIIPKEKTKIYMEGDVNKKPIIQFNDVGSGSKDSATVRVYAEYFVAVGISFKNTFNKVLPFRNRNGKKIKVAPAILLEGDKLFFSNCDFKSVQDTICDNVGRHYFQYCYIEGAVDFIWGYAQSIYNRCDIYVSKELGSTRGYITAQGRNSEQDTSGYVFTYCKIHGAKAYLGRAYRAYSRVIYYKCFMTEAVVPLGWDIWSYRGSEGNTEYAEVECKGPGSDKKGRVPWEKNLSPERADFFKDRKKFIDQDRWMENLPVSIL